MPPHQEFRHMSSGSLNIPAGGINGVNGQPHIGGNMGGRFENQARSPPAKQNTSHVPCKFFRQGACQAGQSCPFSHDLNSTVDNVCKYFAKGNCKFGPKCANAHILPNGQRVNYKAPMMGGNLNIGGRMHPDPYRAQPSALTNGFSGGAPAGGPPSMFAPGQFSLFGNPDDAFPVPTPTNPRASLDNPLIDTTFASRQTSAYGSPRDEEPNRFGYGLSPQAARGTSILDAPLPASFDSHGNSAYANHAIGKGALASSVPVKFGLNTPPGSLGVTSSETLKSLQASAFGDDGRDRFNGNSPPGIPTEEYFGKRMMHSHRAPKSKIMSASLPKRVDQDWNFGTFDEDDVDLLPEALEDLMTPQEKARRGSRNADDEGRPILSGAGTPINAGTPLSEIGGKWGSPSNASPSRWGPLWSRHQQEKDEEKSTSRGSAFGHVGSPLRNSSLHPAANPASRPITRPSLSGDSSPYAPSPPRQTNMSGITQLLQRTRLSRAESTGSDTGLHPARAASNPIGSGARTVAERQISSSGIGGSGRFTTPIDEEQTLFKMDGMDDDEKKPEKQSEKRNSGGWTLPPGKTTTNGNGVDGMFGSR
ncbi:hypothetical protein B0O99DRAFT_689837 [Bisporella sp. PMI_857]|nr:hypothetical protein B0O99DRAFT_689837 [Bisporella sp. PMI_857]